MIASLADASHAALILDQQGLADEVAIRPRATALWRSKMFDTATIAALLGTGEAVVANAVCAGEPELLQRCSR